MPGACRQAAGLRALGQLRPYVDLARVCIWGWSGDSQRISTVTLRMAVETHSLDRRSGGGSNTLNAMFRKPGVYQAGIAVRRGALVSAPCG